MKITKKQLKRLILEELRRVVLENSSKPIDREPLKDILAHDDPADVIHAMHPAWEGGEHGSEEAENLVLPIDHSAAGGSDPVTKETEIMSIAKESRLTRNKLQQIIYEEMKKIQRSRKF